MRAVGGTPSYNLITYNSNRLPIYFTKHLRFYWHAKLKICAGATRGLITNTGNYNGTNVRVAPFPSIANIELRARNRINIKLVY